MHQQQNSRDRCALKFEKISLDKDCNIKAAFHVLLQNPNREQNQTLIISEKVFNAIKSLKTGKKITIDNDKCVEINLGNYVDMAASTEISPTQWYEQLSISNLIESSKLWTHKQLSEGSIHLVDQLLLFLESYPHPSTTTMSIDFREMMIFNNLNVEAGVQWMKKNVQNICEKYQVVNNQKIEQLNEKDVLCYINQVTNSLNLIKDDFPQYAKKTGITKHQYECLQEIFGKLDVILRGYQSIVTKIKQFEEEQSVEYQTMMKVQNEIENLLQDENKIEIEDHQMEDIVEKIEMVECFECQLSFVQDKCIQCYYCNSINLVNYWCIDCFKFYGNTNLIVSGHNVNVCGYCYNNYHDVNENENKNKNQNLNEHDNEATTYFQCQNCNKKLEEDEYIRCFYCQQDDVDFYWCELCWKDNGKTIEDDGWRRFVCLDCANDNFENEGIWYNNNNNNNNYQMKEVTKQIHNLSFNTSIDIAPEIEIEKK
eukprot:137992_1